MQTEFKENVELNNPYFELLAEIGMTKHPQGIDATLEMVEKCNIKKRINIFWILVVESAQLHVF